jgi:hypothetical protein
VKKIALIGSAPSSVALAPFDDPSWEIWACSPGSYPHLKRCDMFFELHRWEPKEPWFSTDYINFLKGLSVPVQMFDVQPDIPGAVAYPVNEMLAEFGPYFFTSSLAWMAALAITVGKADAIGYWGVDMSAQEEWEGQRGGCQFFIHEARKRGIAVIAPHESDLLRPPPLYGLSECNPMYVKLRARDRELTQRYHAAAATMQQKQREMDHLAGALDDNKYQMKTWIAEQSAIDLAYTNPPLRDFEPQTSFRHPDEGAQKAAMPVQTDVGERVTAAAQEILSSSAVVVRPSSGANGRSTDMVWPPEYPVERLVEHEPA